MTKCSNESGGEPNARTLTAAARQDGRFAHGPMSYKHFSRTLLDPGLADRTAHTPRPPIEAARIGTTPYRRDTSTKGHRLA
jgi:hypothetical protein